MIAATSSSTHLSGRQRVIVLVLLGAGFMLSLDYAILNVALPEVGAGVGLRSSGLAWIVSAYTLPAAGLALLFGRLADLFGRRRLTTPFVISESTLPDRVKVDLPGAVTVTGGLLAVVYAVIEGSAPLAAIGLLLLVAFWVIERRSPAPLVPVHVLLRPTVKWGDYAGLVVFSMETGMIFLITLYLQNVLGLSPLATGLVFGIPGLAAIAAGPIAGRLIGRFSSRRVLTSALAVQGLVTLPLVFLGTDPVGLAVLVPALLVGFFAHVTCIVAYTVTGTSGLPNEEQGLATGLTSMTQQVGVTIGAPVLGSIAATQSVPLSGTHLALGVDVAVTLASVVLIRYGLRPRPEHEDAGPRHRSSLNASRNWPRLGSGAVGKGA